MHWNELLAQYAFMGEEKQNAVSNLYNELKSCSDASVSPSELRKLSLLSKQSADYYRDIYWLSNQKENKSRGFSLTQEPGAGAFL